MKRKVLLVGNQDAIIDDFFLHTEETFYCLSTSTRPNDIKMHFKFFDPEVVVYCLTNDVAAGSEDIRYIKRTLRNEDAVIVGIGNKQDLDDLDIIATQALDLELTKPITIKKIQEEIENAVKKREEIREELERAKAEEEAKAAEAAEKAARANVKKHILVVDDDPLMLKTIKGYLEEKYVVATAPSGKIAMKFLEQRHTDFVLLDYEMPEVTGPDVFKMIKENPGTMNTPVVFLTGITDSAKIKTVLAMQPNGYLLKPVDYDRLHLTIENLIG